MVLGLKAQNGSFNYGHIYALYGQTRSGKSSILIHFTSRAKEVLGNSVIIADCGELPEAGDNSDNILYIIAYTIYKSIEKANESEVNKPIEQEKIIEIKKITEDMLEHKDRAEARFKRFNEAVSEIPFLKDKLVLIIMDEFTHIHNLIKDGKLSSNFMMLLKAFFGQHRYSAIIAAQENIIDFRKEFPNAFGIMELERVTYLRKEDALIDLIEKPLSIEGKTIFEKSASERLFDLTHGSPFLIVKLCNMIAEYFNRKKLSKITYGFFERFLEDEVFNGSQSLKEEDFEPQISDRANPDVETYQNNRIILLAIAKLTENDAFVPLDKVVIDGISDSKIIDTIERLVQRDVLEKNENAEYRIKISLLREWLVRNYG